MASCPPAPPPSCSSCLGAPYCYEQTEPSASGNGGVLIRHTSGCCSSVCLSDSGPASQPCSVCRLSFKGCQYKAAAVPLGRGIREETRGDRIRRGRTCCLLLLCCCCLRAERQVIGRSRTLHCCMFVSGTWWTQDVLFGNPVVAASRVQHHQLLQRCVLSIP